MILKVDADIELRRLQPSDATAIFTTINQEREYLGKWLPFVAHTRKVEDVLGFINHVTDPSKEASEFPFTIQKDNNFAGLIHLKSIDVNNNKTDIGYWLSEKYQGQGIMTRSLQALCDFGFGELDLNRIQVKCGVGNTGSSNIPKRLGFTFEGIERAGELLSDHTYIDLEVYSKLKTD